MGSDMRVTRTYKTTERVSHNYTANPKSLPVDSEIMPTVKATKTPTRVCTTNCSHNYDAQYSEELAEHAPVCLSLYPTG